MVNEIWSICIYSIIWQLKIMLRTMSFMPWEDTTRVSQAWDQPGLHTDGMENAHNKIKMKLHTSDMQTERAWLSEIFLSMSFDTQINAFQGNNIEEGEIIGSYVYICLALQNWFSICIVSLSKNWANWRLKIVVEHLAIQGLLYLFIL